MSAPLRYLLLCATRSRAPLVPLAATLFAVTGVYAYRRNEPDETFALTALLACGLAAWLVGAVLDGEPRPQGEMATAALGGRRARTRVDALLAGVVAVLMTVVFVGLPPLAALAVPELYEPSPGAGELAAAAVGHLGCALVGGAVAVVFAPPRITRRASAAALVLAALLALVALGGLAGPVAVADALDEGSAGALLLASASCAALAAAAVAAAGAWGARAG